MDTMSQQIHTNTNHIDNLTTAVDTCSRRLDNGENSQSLFNHSTNKTNSGNTTSKKIASLTSTRQKSDLQNLPTRIRANIKNIEALAEWMGDIATSVESLKEQAGEQQEREEKVPGHESESQSESSLGSGPGVHGQLNDIIDALRLRQQQSQQQQQQVSEEKGGSKEKEKAQDVEMGHVNARVGDLFVQSDRSHTETEEGGVYQDETSQRSEAGETGHRGIEVTAVGDDRFDYSLGHWVGNKGQSDEDGLEKIVEDVVRESQQSIGVDNGGESPRDEVAPLTKLFRKNKTYNRLFDQVASLYPQLPESEVLELADSFEIPLRMPKTVDGICDIWFVSEEGRPSIWQLEVYVKKWRKMLVFTESKHAWFMFSRQLMVIEMVLETLSSFPDGSLEARVLAAKEIVSDTITANGSILSYLNKVDPKSKVAKA
ncbi:hypothetical protein BGZ96_004970 [Linnemannia gamsii]|uniref:Uncharacterized protein n=1 Tax=Linnemannia gamsii TaxID=64522 RepID=A0ABQ7K639_9FUNG|nr:hypothetical protein BGZ96_004970 [Linnemannia gamsii]